jgi:hypothetical protein
MKPPARAIAGHVIWSNDGGVWALWRIQPFPHAYGTVADKLATHARLRGLLIGLPERSMLLSITERLDPWEVIAYMTDGVDLDTRPAWAQVCEATAAQLEDRPLHRRRHYLAAELPAPTTRRPLLDAWHRATEQTAASFGIPPRPLAADEISVRHRQADALERTLGAHRCLDQATAGEIRWLYTRALHRGTNEPAYDHTWEPPPLADERGGAVLAPLTDAIVKEGGYPDDPQRPRHRRYLRVDAGDTTSYQTCLAVADMPHEFTFPGGGGEWLYHLDHIGAPIDWCVRLRSIPNAQAQTKLRRQQRQLVGQIDEYDGEVTGTPPSLADAIAAVDDQRATLAANPNEPELHATIILSVAAANLDDLEDQAAAITALFEPHDYGIFRPTGGQTALLRSMLPGTRAANVCSDYTQYLLPRDLAAGAPFCGPIVGDPRGSLLGYSLDSGTPTPVLIDPTYGPSIGRSASVAAIGALGTGKSYLLKRLCWDTVARGGQVVTIDRTAIGEYAHFAATLPARTQIVDLAADTQTVGLDPLRSFDGDDRTNITLGFLSLLTGATTHSDEGAALAEAVHTTAARPGARLSDVVDHLHRMGESSTADPAARSLARRLHHYQHTGIGRPAFGDGPSVDLDADLIVFWAPHLALPDRDTLLNPHLTRQLLPEEVLGSALIYLIAATARRVVFADPTRFGAALYDEAWVLLASPHGQRLVLESIRDGRKHNGAIWLATQHPGDIGTGELLDLLGPRFVFHQAPGAVNAATEFLGIPGSDDATETLRRGLPTGRCLYRDVRDRVGLIDIAPPALDHARHAADTTPNHAGPRPPRPTAVPQATPTSPTTGRPTDPGNARHDRRQNLGVTSGPARLRHTPLADALADQPAP